MTHALLYLADFIVILAIALAARKQFHNLKLLCECLAALIALGLAAASLQTTAAAEAPARVILSATPHIHNTAWQRTQLRCIGGRAATNVT